MNERQIIEHFDETADKVQTIVWLNGLYDANLNNRITIYVYYPSHTFNAEEKKNPTQYNKLLRCTTGQFTVMHAKTHVITIEENSIPNTIFINGVTPVPTRMVP